MLLLGELLFPEPRVLWDKQTNKLFSVMYKNGYTSLTALSSMNPDRYKLTTLADPEINGIGRIKLFVRDPVSRYVSGLAVQMKIYGMDKEEVLDNLARHQILMFDNHTHPQIWYLAATQKYGNYIFDVVDVAQLNSIDSSMPHLNQSSHALPLADHLAAHIRWLYTEDKVLCESFSGKETTLGEVIDTIYAQEPEYASEVASYFNQLCSIMR